MRCARRFLGDADRVDRSAHRPAVSGNQIPHAPDRSGRGAAARIRAGARTCRARRRTITSRRRRTRPSDSVSVRLTQNLSPTSSLQPRPRAADGPRAGGRGRRPRRFGPSRRMDAAEARWPNGRPRHQHHAERPAAGAHGTRTIRSTCFRIWRRERPARAHDADLAQHRHGRSDPERQRQPHAHTPSRPTRFPASTTSPAGRHQVSQRRLAVR